MNSKEKNKMLKEAAEVLNTNPESLPDIIMKLKKEIKESEGKIREFS